MSRLTSEKTSENANLNQVQPGHPFSGDLPSGRADAGACELPTDNHRSHRTRPAYDTFVTPISDALQRLVTQAAAKHNTQPDQWVLSCYFVFLYRLTHASHVSAQVLLPTVPKSSTHESLSYESLSQESSTHKPSAQMLNVSCRLPAADETSDSDDISILLSQVDSQWHAHEAGASSDTPAATSVLGFNADSSLAFTENSLQPDWCFNLTARSSRQELECTFDTRLNSHDTMVHRIDQFLRVLTLVSHQPETRLSSISLMTQRDQDLITSVNSTQVDIDSTAGFIDQFMRRVAERPDHTAVADATNSLTYRQLDHRSNQLAHHLIATGVKGHDIVGICLPRGVSMVIAMLAIQKTGAAWLPLDPDHPEQRLHYTVDHAKVSLLITQSSVSEIWGSYSTPLLLLSDEEQILKTRPTTLPDRQYEADSTAYVIYTSGSTGKPKGVRVSHHNLHNFLQAMRLSPGLTADDRLLAVTTLSFDIAILELLLPLSVGASVIICDRDTMLDGQALSDALNDHAITCMQATPTVWRLLLDSGWTGQPNLTALAGGESLPKDLVKPLLERTAALWNMYGPTETTIWSTCQLVTDANAPIRIGRPIANTQLHILNEALEPVAIGLPGELCIGGFGVAQGYLHRPDLTSERFVTVNGVRMYRTGDLCRLLADGSLDYIARLDNQIKLRGFRIETGEIEAILSEYPTVLQAVVGLSAVTDGNPELVAWYTSRQSEPVSVSDLSAHVAQHLPGYMVPRYFEPVYTMPTTPNGKIDRKALPAPRPVRPLLNTDFIEAAGTLEKTLSALWCEVLGIDSVGVNDSFFELGGNSITAVKMLAKLNADTGHALGVVDLFRSPTISRLAQALNDSPTAKLSKADSPLTDSATANVPPAETVPHAPECEPVATHTDGDCEHSADDAVVIHNAQQDAQAVADDDIAVIGMAARFPGARSIEEFWQNLLDGKETLTRFTAEELDDSIDPSLKDDPHYVPVRGILDDVDQFDADFFGTNPSEANVTDPQQRVLLQLCWHALEDAGIVVPLDNRIAVYAGVNNNTYYTHNVLSNPDMVHLLGALQISIANEKDYVATRIAHRLNLKGPALSLHTACSTSLVAIVEAFHALKAGRCDMALAGAASITSPVNSGHVYQDGDIMSRDGHCSPFDDDASGTLFCDGAGVVVLKRLKDARADGDRIVAVIRGAAINNDGGDKMSFMSPGIDGQAHAITEALASARLDASAISYVEAHGTATPVGDPVEIAALTQAYRESTSDTGFCAIGSVKSNIGHVTAAAGVAGFIKTCLSLQHQQIPATINFRTPNRRINFEASPFYVNDTLRDWALDDQPYRIAGVSSFGVGGTNAHVIVQEATRPEDDQSITNTATDDTVGVSGPQLLLHSGKTAEACQRNATQVRSLFESSSIDGPVTDKVNAPEKLSPSAIAGTLRDRRTHFDYRSYSVVAPVDGNAADVMTDYAVTQLGSVSTGASSLSDADSAIAFIVPGQGSQYAGMGEDLYTRYPVFKQALDQCFTLYTAYTGDDLKAVMFSDDSEKLDQTQYTQPALFSLCYAMAKLWKSARITPCAVLGHSIGEYVAAHLAGVFSLESAIQLVSERGRLMQSMPAGSMLSVRLAPEAIGDMLSETIALAAINGPAQCVLAGPTAAIDALEETLNAREVSCRRLATSHAFHSPMMDGVLEPFTQILKQVNFHAPATPFVSCTTGTWISDSDAVSPEYWASHVRLPVKFYDGVRTLLTDSTAALLEIGPGKTGVTLARQLMRQHAGDESTSDTAANEPSTRLTVASLKRSRAPGDEQTTVLAAAGHLWAGRLNITPEALMHAEPGVPVSLPGYAFEPVSHWLPAMPHQNASRIDTIEQQQTHTVLPTGQPTEVTPMPNNQSDRIQAQLRTLLEDSSGISLADVSEEMDFMDAGLDSLFLTRTGHLLKETFDINVSFRDLTEKYCTLSLLSNHIESLQPDLPVETLAVETHQVAVPAVDLPVDLSVDAQTHTTQTQSADVPPPEGWADSVDVEAMITAQLQIMSRQLDLLRDARAHRVPQTQTRAQAQAAANDELSALLRHKQQSLTMQAKLTNVPEHMTAAALPPEHLLPHTSARASSTPAEIAAAYTDAGIATLEHPPIAQAVLGLTDAGEAAWFVADPDDPDALQFYKSA